MTVAVRMTLNSQQLKNITNKLEKRLPDEVDKSLYGYAQLLTKTLRHNTITDPLRPITKDRRAASQLIVARKQSKFRSVVKMPQSLIYLDSMKPHYVPLKRGRNITRWAQRNYGSARVGNKSRVLRGPRGGIIYQDGQRSALFVTPHPFINKSIKESSKGLPRELKKGITRAFRKGAS